MADALQNQRDPLDTDLVDALWSRAFPYSLAVSVLGTFIFSVTTPGHVFLH